MLRHCYFGLAIAAALASSASAELRHQYTFNDGTGNDAIGGRHGTVVNPMGLPAFNGGQLDLTSNNTETNGNISSNQQVDDGDPTNFTQGMYLDLPNFMISELARESGDIMSFEAWVAIDTNRTWSRIFDFGTSNLGEDTAVAADSALSEYIFLTANSGVGGLEFTTRSVNQINGFAAGAPSPQTDTQHHYVGVIDQTDTTEGANGSLYVYLDGELVGSGAVADGYFMQDMFDLNNWLGRSQWADPLIDASYNEFRIYDHALSAEEVAESYETGPEAVNPRFIVNRDDQSITLVSRGIDGDLAGYSLTSASGALDDSQWTPISGRLDSAGDGSFDEDATWDVSSSTVDELAEAASSGTGGGLNSETSISLGNIWVPSLNEDLVPQIQLADGSIVPGEIQYVGNGGVPFGRSDLNFDGVVDANDWPVFVENLFGDFSGLSEADAYGMGDLNGDFVSDVRDFRLFQADFIAANGAAAFSALSGSGAVPEPSTVALAMLLIAFAALLRFGRPYLTLARQTVPKRALSAVLIGVGGLVGVSAAQAEMVHRWSFNEDSGTAIADLIGGADGELIGAGGTLGGGSVTLPGGPSASAPYVDLPNGIVSSLTNATFEGWAVVDGAQSWGRLFDFGSTMVDGVPGEVLGPGGGGEGQDYFMYSPFRGTDVNVQRAEFRNLDPAFGGDDAGNVTATTQLQDTGIATEIGVEFHYAIVFDSDADELRQYRNGQFIASSPVTFELGNLNDVNNWLGRSNWTADANFQGSFNEFRIYDTALDDFEVGTSFVGGPDVGEEGPPVLELEVDRGTGEVVLHNRQVDPIDFQYYEIISPSGALNVNGWSSLDDQDLDAIGSGPGESWDAGGASDAFELGEAFLLGNTSLGAGESIELGNAINPSVIGEGDLNFRYLRGDGFGLIGQVSYIGEPGGGGDTIPGDYNNNGRVEQADLDLVLLNWNESVDNLPADWINERPMDGIIDQAELDGVLLNWNRTTPGLGAASAVPEPATLVLLAAAALGVGLRRLVRKPRL